jgi:hypothetical protein
MPQPAHTIDWTDVIEARPELAAVAADPAMAVQWLAEQPGVSWIQVMPPQHDLYCLSLWIRFQPRFPGDNRDIQVSTYGGWEALWYDACWAMVQPVVESDAKPMAITADQDKEIRRLVRESGFNTRPIALVGLGIMAVVVVGLLVNAMV